MAPNDEKGEGPAKACCDSPTEDAQYSDRNPRLDQQIPFEELAVSLYFYCQDVNMAQFTRWYEAQLELAGANKEKFATGLHRFFTETAKKIQKNICSVFMNLTLAELK